MHVFSVIEKVVRPEDYEKLIRQLESRARESDAAKNALAVVVFHSMRFHIDDFQRKQVALVADRGRILNSEDDDDFYFDLTEQTLRYVTLLQELDDSGFRDGQLNLRFILPVLQRASTKLIHLFLNVPRQPTSIAFLKLSRQPCTAINRPATIDRLAMTLERIRIPDVTDPLLRSEKDTCSRVGRAIPTTRTYSISMQHKRSFRSTLSVPESPESSV